MLQLQQILEERYQLQERLGNNPTRQTWLATDRKTRQQIIVKLLPLSPQIQWEDIKLFERESQVLKTLDHSRIPRYLDHFFIDKELGSGLSWFALVQEYIPGVSLQQLLASGKKFTEVDVKEIATQLLNILIYLHELSPPVLHRDIKPSNILQGKDGKIYLVDFGAVQDKAKAEGMTFTVVGTGGYAPPEQLWGRAVAASDLYALGATLIHLLTGIAPSELPQEEMRLQFRDKVKVSSGLANWLETLVDPAVEKRFARGKEALEALKVSHKSQRQNLEVDWVHFEKINYGNLCRVGVCSLSVLILAAIVLPSLLGKANKAIQSEAKQNIGVMNRAQQAYVLNSESFATSIEDLEIGIRTQTENYQYSLRSTPLYAIHYATPLKKDTTRPRGYVGMVVFVPGNSRTGEFLTITEVCETKKTTTHRPPEPIFKDGVILCPPGTKELYGGSGKIELSHDWQLAYESLALAEAGNFDRALKLAQAIQDKRAKEKALQAIAREKQAQ